MMASAASLTTHQTAAPSQASPVGMAARGSEANTSPADSPVRLETERGQEAAFQHRMDQFLRRREEEHEEGGRDGGEEYRMLASETSGSNSGEEDDREMSENPGKRLGGHFNGLSSKKRRKQSKPLRLGAEVEAGTGRGSSPEPGEFPPRYRSTSGEDEAEDGEKRSEGPLNLSREEGEKPATLRVLGPELMSHPGWLGAAGDEAGARSGNPNPSSLYQGMLPFGLSPFPFPFPNHPPTSGSGGRGNSTGSLASSGGPGGKPQIFNPEAYCGLCNKEFCNKYFLKTHKANKHGIYSDSASEGGRSGGGPPPLNRSPGPLMPPTSNSSSSQQLNQTPPSAGQRSEGGQSEQPGGPPTPNSQAGSPFSGAFIAANMGALRPPFMPLSPGASPSPNSSQHRSDNAATNGEARDRDSLERDEAPRPRSRDAASPTHDGEHKSEDKGAHQEDLRKSLESPRSGSIPPSLPPNFSKFNPIMFGGLPSLDALRKEEEKRQEASTPRSLPHIPNIPTISSGSPGSGPKGPFTPDKLRQMGVINADAFCEICCKEFCNKYFLRVHKLKKHGICSPDLPPEKVQKILNQMAKEAGKSGNPPPPIIRPSLTSGAPSTPGLDKMSPVAAAMSGLPFGNNILPPHLRAPGALNLGSGIMQFPPLEPLLPQALKDFPPLPKMPTAPIPVSGISDSGKEKDKDKETASDKDKSQEIIRINDDSQDTNTNDDKNSTTREDNGDDKTNSQDSNGPSNGQNAASEDLQRLQSMIMELNSNKGAQMDKNGTLCKICNKDMENKYFLRAHMMNEHGVLHTDDLGADKGLPPFPLTNGNAATDLSQPTAAAAAADFASKFLQQMQKGIGTNFSFDDGELSFLERVKNELSGSPKKAEKDPNRKPASLSRSYCEICKKELCNKYFMKTHMMKMHGINIEATGNSGGVSCHLCNKELCSKYFLKVHLQNSHGINEDGSPVPSNLRENGSSGAPGGGVGGGGLFGGLFPPPPEMLGLPASPDKDRYFSRLLNEQSEASRERMKEMERQKQQANNTDGSSHTCSLCGDEFPEIVALQVHIIKSHGAFPPDSSFLKGDGKRSVGRSRTGSESGDGPGSKDQEDTNKTDSKKVDGMATPDNTKDGDESHNVSSSSTKANSPSVPASISSSFPFPGLEALTTSTSGAAAEAAAKQFPHIEMLQRHMLSAQFPGLINPLLSGFPGFPPTAPGSGLPFPNPLQQLLGGKAPNTPQEESPKKESSTSSSKAEPLSSGKKSKRRFKCSKCSQKFRDRQTCLHHIQKSHAPKGRRSGQRKLQFPPSPLKRLTARSQTRSQYVKQLMELLKVPTTRGTPQSPETREGGHIMQPFLLRAPEDEVEPQHQGQLPAEVKAEINFVPSLVYLPVAKRVSQPLKVAFNLTPA